MTEALKTLLFDLRAHPGFQDLLKAVEAPRRIRYRRGIDLQAMGAEFVYFSGALDQHERWIALLKGSSLQEDLTNE